MYFIFGVAKIHSFFGANIFYFRSGKNTLFFRSDEPDKSEEDTENLSEENKLNENSEEGE